MLAIVYSQNNKEGVKEVEFKSPKLKSKTNSHVLVKVYYCGVNPVDAKYNVGDKLPNWLKSLGRLSMDGRGLVMIFQALF